LLSEKSTADWLVADVDLVLRENTAGWLTDKAIEQSAMFCTQHSSCMFTEVLSAFALFVQGAPHPPQLLMSDTWTKPYSREYAAFPAAWLRGAKFWPTTGRVDNVYGDHNLICTLQQASQVAEEAAAATA